jgi:hypothetical protein|tara:strand:+ start:553 stop:771 length:219 start_codon:yes stop_codon:yes gene_type:complete
MNKLYLFLFLVIVFALSFQKPIYESMRTLRGAEKKYSLTSVKNHFHKNVTYNGKKHYNNINNYLSKLSNKWL